MSSRWMVPKYSNFWIRSISERLRISIETIVANIGRELFNGDIDILD